MFCYLVAKDSTNLNALNSGDMKWPTLSPGTILQHMYLKERLRRLRPARFIDVSCGKGHASRILLDAGWRGVGCDLNPDSLAAASALNSDAISDGRYLVSNGDWLDGDGERDVDLIIRALCSSISRRSKRPCTWKGLRRRSRRMAS